MVTGREVCHVAAMIGLDDFRIFRVERDDELIAIMREKELAFWELVQTQTPPPIESAEDALLAWPSSQGIAVEVSMDIAGYVADLKDIKAAIKDLEKREEALKDAILPHFGSAERMEYAGHLLATWKSQDARRLDQKALSAAYPDIVDQFKVTSSTRVLRIK